jgi:hypothetical protein
MAENMRQHPRKAVRVQFTCRDDDGEGELFFDSSDLSTGGTFLVSDLLLEMGDSLTLEFSLPGGAALRCEAKVAWVRRFPARGEQPGMGIEFRELPEFDQRALEAFLGS